METRYAQPRAAEQGSQHDSTPMTVRVMHVLEPLEGGALSHVIDLVGHVRDVEHAVAVPPRRVGGLTNETGLAQLKAAGATIHLLPMRRTPWAAGNAVAFLKLIRLLRSHRPDVVHAHSSIGGLLARTAAIGLGRPRLYTPHGVTTVRAGRAVERLLGPLTERFIAVSQSEAALVLRLRLVGSDRLVVIPNGIELRDPEPVDLRGLLGVPADAPLVGMVARLVAGKAPLDFVAACAKIARAVPGSRFVLIGGGTLSSEVDAAVRTEGLTDRFTRIEALNGVPGALGSLDVYTLTTLGEAGPYTPLEAMRAGTAVVLTDVDGNRDTIEHEVSGVLVPPSNPAALAAAITDLLGDTERRERLAAAGRARVRERFDIRIMAERYSALYTSLAAK